MVKQSKPGEDPTQDELNIMQEIAGKYGLNNDRGASLLISLSVVLQMSGFGRNEETTRLLRTMADILDDRRIQPYEGVNDPIH